MGRSWFRDPVHVLRLGVLARARVARPLPHEEWHGACLSSGNARFRPGAGAENHFKNNKPKEGTQHGQDSRNRPRNDQQLHGRHGRRRARRHPQRGGQPHDALRRRVHQVRRAPRRPGRQAPGRHQPQEHRLLDQALHGPPLRRGGRRDLEGPLRGRPRSSPSRPTSTTRSARPPRTPAASPASRCCAS